MKSLILTAILISFSVIGIGQKSRVCDSCLTIASTAWTMRTITGIDSNYIEMTSDSIFSIHGDTQYVLRDMSRRENHAWEEWGKMSALHAALSEVVKNIPNLYSGDGKKYNIAQKRYLNLLRNYNKK